MESVSYIKGSSKQSEYQRAWRKRHPEKHAEQQRKYRARKREYKKQNAAIATSVEKEGNIPREEPSL